MNTIKLCLDAQFLYGIIFILLLNKNFFKGINAYQLFLQHI